MTLYPVGPGGKGDQLPGGPTPRSPLILSLFRFFFFFFFFLPLIFIMNLVEMSFYIYTPIKHKIIFCFSFSFLRK
jgi:hypothetical protein